MLDHATRLLRGELSVLIYLGYHAPHGGLPRAPGEWCDGGVLFESLAPHGDRTAARGGGRDIFRTRPSRCARGTRPKLASPGFGGPARRARPQPGPGEQFLANDVRWASSTSTRYSAFP